MLSYSKSTVYVNELVSTALSVVQEAVSKSSESANLTNVLSLDGCDGADWSHIDMKQVYKLNMSSLRF